MTDFKKTATVILLAGLGFTGTSQAALWARGTDMVYDDVNKITWAADGNLFQTESAGGVGVINEITTNGNWILDTPNIYDSPENSGSYTVSSVDFNFRVGKMTWFGAQAWANNLTLGGFTDWSLPTTVPAFASYSPTGSQMGALYNQLINGLNDGSGIAASGTANSNLFINLQNFEYWSVTETEFDPNSAWSFDTSTGFQHPAYKNGMFYALAVRSGDVAAVPVPAAVWLFLSGLMGVLSFNRRKNKTVNLTAA